MLVGSSKSQRLDLMRVGLLLVPTAFVATATVATPAHAIDPFVNGSDAMINNTLTSGVAIGVADMDRDGLDDIVRLNNAQDLEIEYQQPDGSFVQFNYGAVGGFSWAIALGDVNNDGYRDIFTGGAYNGLKILIANEDGTDFSQSTVNQPQVFVQCTNFADIDNDGALDLFVCHDDGLSAPLANDGNGNFTHDTTLINAFAAAGNDHSGNYGSVWSDYDLDGDTDLYLAKCRLGVNDPNDGRRMNILYRNDGGGNWTEVAGDVGLRPLAQSWSLDFGDIDNDGDFDAFMVNHDQISGLYRNDGPGEDLGNFTEITVPAGIAADLGTIGEGIQTLFADFDNDTFVDLVVTGRNGQHRLYMNNGDSTFTAEDAPFPTGGPGIQSAVIGDLNNDGFLDLVAGFATGYNNPSNNPDRLFINPTNDNHWIGFRLEGVTSNRDGVGARIDLTGSWGTQVREVRAGEGYGISTTFLQHFGLGTSQDIDTVTITWPSGQVDSFDYAAIDTVHHVTEGCPDEFYADVDGDGFGDSRVTIGGCVPPEGYAVDATDCADDDENNFPGNPEICDGADNNCSGEADEGIDCDPGDTGTDTGGGTTAGVSDTGTDSDTGAPGLDDTTGSPSADGTTSAGPVTTTPMPSDDSGDGDSSGGDAGADGDGGGDDGCGCRSTGSNGGGWLMLLVLPLLARRRRS